jgi:cellulose synthase/poly-beta-1,6-N-acetylglucosamine synthase-like glycosyltransferase
MSRIHSLTDLPTDPLLTHPLQMDAQIQRYRSWLAAQSHPKLRQYAEIERYQHEAAVIQTYRGKEIAPFAPFHRELSALQTFTPWQVISISLFVAAWVVSLALLHLAALTAALALLTLVYTLCLCVNVLLAFQALRGAADEQIDDAIVKALAQAPWPRYTVLCPLYKEARIVPQFVQAMLALDYPLDRLQVLFLTEEGDRDTRAAIRALALPPSFQIVVVPEGQPRTKPRACNYGLLQASGSYVVIYDAEDIPDPLQLKKAILTFANHDLQTVCVQAKLNFYNSTQNLLTRWFTAEYSTWFSFILPGLQRANFVVPLGGTSNHFRANALRALGGWDAYNVTEDCDLGLRLKRFQMKTVILDSTTLEEANPDLKNWMRQRSRWIKGYMQTYLVHMRSPLKTVKEGRLADFLSFQVVVGSGVGLLFFNPLMWLLMASYLVVGDSVIALYHQLFPGPFLYAGAFCLIFGNFFYVYLYLLACARRRAYHLIPWAVFIPVYWLLMSVAGIYAFLELLVRPHYWQKTTHGYHLNQGGTAFDSQAEGLIQQATLSVPAIRAVPRDAGASLRTITARMKAIATLPVPALSFSQRKAGQRAAKARVKDLWLMLLLLVSSALSLIALCYYAQQHDLLIYEDAFSHMRIARSVFDSATPGLAQLGTVWLPLPHVLMWPFIWNDALWHSGLAGSFVAMPCYVIAAAYLFLAARKLTGNSLAAFVGTLAFVCNPNILYVQTTPLSELVCLATSSMTCYYFLVWIEQETLAALVMTSLCVFLATLSRYDGWPLFLFVLCGIPMVCLIRKKRWLYIEGHTMLFAVVGGAGIVLWLIWNKLIFGDPLYFQHSNYSSQAQQMVQLHLGTLFTYHNFWLSLKYYAVDTQQIVGNGLFLVLLVGVVWFLLRNGNNPLIFGYLAFFVPFAFYVFALYNGNAIIWIPQALPTDTTAYLYNVRYGVQMVPALAITLAFLLSRLQRVTIPRFPVKPVLIAALLALIVGQSVLVQMQGVVSVQDGEYNVMCQPHHDPLVYLEEHYNGGNVLQDVFTVGYDASDTGIINFRQVIYEGSGPLWQQAIRHPATYAQWLLVNVGNPLDALAQRMQHDPTYLAPFLAVAHQSNGVVLYQRIAKNPLAHRAAPPFYGYSHHPCMNRALME